VETANILQISEETLADKGYLHAVKMQLNPIERD